MIQKVIKTEEDYQKALSRIDGLMNSELNAAETNELELLVILVELYEEKQYPIGMPDPIEAIKFRMEQQGLSQNDLVPYMGSKSKVSEVLNKKRPLSLSMMRALHKGLAVPAEILLQEQGEDFPADIPGIDWASFPIKEMVDLGWIQHRNQIDGNEEEIMRVYIKEAGGMTDFSELFFHRSKNSQKKLRTNKYSLMAWCLRIMELSRKQRLDKQYDSAKVNLSDVAKLSYFKDGPMLAKEYLEKQGIQFFIVPHLQKTFLDGAAMMLGKKRPVIALTLRYDRIDNFWFCLLHELAHLDRHLSKNETNIIVDELELSQSRAANRDTREKEADRIAQNALIPEKYWKEIDVYSKNLAREVINLSEKIKIHPAIIAGRIRYEKNNYRILTQFIGRGAVKKCFI